MKLRSSFLPFLRVITPLILVSLIFISIICVSEGDKTEDDTRSEQFIPSREWQVVKKGQPIPKGLHVRVNFETGITEAKLLDEKESKNVAISTVSDADVSSDVENNVKKEISRDDIEEAMQKIKNDYKEKENSEQASTPFRNYDELKKDFDEMRMNIKTDMELIQELITSFVTTTKEDKMNILTDLEYLVHQFDNALEFVRLDGFTRIVYPCFNSSSDDIRSIAIKLLGSAVQNNPKVQISALSSGSIQLLLRTILMDKNTTVRSRALYALSCLIRSFPAAQMKMVSEGGLAVLAHAFDKESNKLQLKVVTLVNDLLDERQRTEELVRDQNETSEELRQKLSQYNAIDLEPKLIEAGWCNRVPKLLLSETTSPDSDVVEKILHAMQTLFHICKDNFLESGVKSVLHTLEVWYKDLADAEHDEYFKYLAELAVSLRIKLLHVKDEL